MATYRKIDPRIWNDEKFRALSDQGKLAFLFLLTHPHMTSLGAMRGTIPGLASELGWNELRLREALGEAFRKAMVKVDEKACCLALPNFLKYNRPESPNVVKGWIRAYELIPECELKHEVVQWVKDFRKTYGSLAEGFAKAFERLFEGFRKASESLPTTEQEQEQEQEQDKKGAHPAQSNNGSLAIAFLSAAEKAGAPIESLKKALALAAQKNINCKTVMAHLYSIPRRKGVKAPGKFLEHLICTTEPDNEKEIARAAKTIEYNGGERDPETVATWIGLAKKMSKRGQTK